MIVFAHTKFGLVRIQGSRVKRGAESAPPRSEGVFQIPVQIGLRSLLSDFDHTYLVIHTGNAYPFEIGPPE